MNIKLFAFDLDGTLLDRAGRISAENRRAVAAARASGAEVVLVTGRSWRLTLPYYRELGLTGPAICYLGALMVENGSGWIGYHRPLVPEAWVKLRRLALAEGLSITAVSAADQAVFGSQLPPKDLMANDTAFGTEPPDDFAYWDEWNPYTEIDPGLHRCTSPPTMAAVYGDRAVARVLEAFPEGLPASQFDLTDRHPGETVLHVWHEEVDKGRALARYCQQRKIPPSAVMAVGDTTVDVSMLRFAGIGVAVPDGHPRALEAADWVATPLEAVERVLGARG